jgi:hypothetical protein
MSKIVFINWYLAISSEKGDKKRGPASKTKYSSMTDSIQVLWGKGEKNPNRPINQRNVLVPPYEVDCRSEISTYLSSPWQLRSFGPRELAKLKQRRVWSTLHLGLSRSFVARTKNGARQGSPMPRCSAGRPVFRRHFFKAHGVLDLKRNLHTWVWYDYLDLFVNWSQMWC